MHEIPVLPYKYDALEPHLDEATMRLHHLKHHQGYVDKLNAALEKYPDLAQKQLAELLADLAAVPEAIRTAVQNHGGGHYNHSLFWPMLAPPAKPNQLPEPREQAITLLDQTFGGFDAFRQKFKDAALGLFGSGWVWLGRDAACQTKIVTTANQDTPLSQGIKEILLGVDVWEHAYYLKYQNRRADYLDAFFYVINWGYAEKRLTQWKS